MRNTRPPLDFTDRELLEICRALRTYVTDSDVLLSKGSAQVYTSIIRKIDDNAGICGSRYAITHPLL